MKLLGVWAGALVLAGCGTNEIQGSLSTVLDLEYDKVTLAYTGGDSTGDVMTNGQVSVRFLRSAGDQSENAVLVVTEDLSGLQVSPGSQVNLAQPPPSNVGERGVVTRDVYNDPRKTFCDDAVVPPGPIGRGYMQVNQTPLPGTNQTVTGFFTVTFALGVDFGCGRTAFSSFKAQVQ